MSHIDRPEESDRDTDCSRSSSAIAGLSKLSDFIPGGGVDGYPEDFSDLFDKTNARLLRHAQREGGVVAFRHKDLLGVAATPAVGNVPTEKRAFRRFLGNMIFASNPPLHGPMRQVIQRPLTPSHIPRLHQLAKQIAAHLIDEVIGEGVVDFCSRVSERFTARFWGAIVDMTEDEIERLSEVVRNIAPILLCGSSPEKMAAIAIAPDSYLELMAHAIHRALNSGGNEMLESMAATFNAICDASKPYQCGENIAADVIYGFNTAAAAGASILYQLLLRPKELAAVRTGLAPLSDAVNEGLRLWTPSITTERYTLQGLEFAGVWIPQGTEIIMLWAAGNRDPNAFENPNFFDPYRKQRAETTFGGGVHICPGRYVVRMLVQTILETVLASGVRIELQGARPTWIARSHARQLDRMSMVISRSA